MKHLPLIFIVAFLSGLSRTAPAGVDRTLKTFDFEERRLGNQEDLPMHWSKVAGPGLPHYVNGRLSSDRHRSGEYSFRFDLDGGSLVYRCDPGLLRVQRGAHYRVEAYCQTTKLAHARARLTAYLADADGKPLPDSVRHSRLFAAERDDQDWQRLGVELSADTPQSVSLVVELELLQPAQYLETTLGARALFEQDIHGSAWWDDVSVAQVPKVTLRTDRPGNVFPKGQPIGLQVRLNDSFTNDLSAQLSVRDGTHKERFQKSGALDIQHAAVDDEGWKQITVELPDLPIGWYQAQVSMSSGGQSLGDYPLAFVVVGDDGPVDPDERFGLIATNLPAETWAQLPRLLPTFASGRVKLAVWDDAGGVSEANGAEFDQLLLRLQEHVITPTACLLAPPPVVQQKLNGHGWRKLLTAAPQTWQPDLSLLVSRHATHLEHWQLGADGGTEFVTDPEMRQVYQKVYAQFAQLVGEPDLAMPWPAWYELPADRPRSVALSIPPSVLPDQIGLYVQDLKATAEQRLSLTLQTLDRDRFGRDMQVQDLAERLVYALAAGAKRIDLPAPFFSRGTAGSASLEPDELYPVVRTLLGTLGSAKYKGRISLDPDVEAFLFERGGQGILVLWGRQDMSGVRDLALNLGERPVSIDLWGNVTPLARGRGDDRDRVSLHVGPMPTFLVDIDAAQAQVRASVAIDRPMIESSTQPHTRRFRFVNAYDHPIAGAVHLKPPKGWLLNPSVLNFNLAAGETFDHEFTVQLPYNSFAGDKTLSCEFLLEGERRTRFDVPLPLKLGLSDVGMQCFAFRDGADVVVQQMVTNYGESPISYSGFAMYPNQARQERLLSNLPPGTTTIKRYRFSKVAEGKAKVRVGLKELEGTRILNEEVEIQ